MLEGGGIEAIPARLLELHIANGYCPVLVHLGSSKYWRRAASALKILT